jgi:hypothetical protein
VVVQVAVAHAAAVRWRRCGSDEGRAPHQVRRADPDGNLLHLLEEIPTNGYRSALNRDGATPLIMAARLADGPLMRLLLELGADPKLTNEDNTALLMVASGVACTRQRCGGS